jgi:uncharacterized protein
MSPASSAACPERGADVSVSVRIVLAVLRVYKMLLSPLFAGACRYTPSCSTYMGDALSEHGLLRGTWLGVRRLARCHPFGGHGYDPVPSRRT